MVEQQQVIDPFGLINGRSGVPSLSFTKLNPVTQMLEPNVGVVHEGVVCAPLDVAPVTVYGSNPPETKKDKLGRDILQVVITLQTQQRDPELEEDDGVRKLYVKLPMQRALQEEMARHGIKSFGEGTHFRIESTGIQQPKAGQARAGIPGQTYKVTLSSIVAPGQLPVQQTLAPQGSVPGAQQSWAPSAPVAAPVAAPPAPAAPALPPMPSMAPPAPQQIELTQAHVDQVNSFVAAGHGRDAAIKALVDWVQQTAGFEDPTYAQRLSDAIPF